MFKKIIQKRLEKRVTQFLKRNPQLKIVAVVGSIGKTTTKHHIGTLLNEAYRIRMHEGGYNTELGVPMSILGLKMPPRLKSVLDWMVVLRAARQESKRTAGFDVLVCELGIDRPGDMMKFAEYLRPSIAVVTAVSPEHMEFFESLDVVAVEELAVSNFSEHTIINRDDVDGKYAELITTPNFDTYGSSGTAEYHFETEDFSLTEGYSGRVVAPEMPDGLPVKINVVGEHSLRPVMGAISVAVKFGLTQQQIAAGLAKTRSTLGRMSVLRGANESLIIDDSYNSSPAAATAALQTLYSIDAPQRIAVLGDMNELGAMSEVLHQELGAFCDSNFLAWVVTVGESAEKYIAPFARQRGCQVKSFSNALEAGGFVRGLVEKGAVVLVKGSQGDIYLEEAIKVFLHSTDDEDRLVRQTPAWLELKHKFFESFSKF